LPDFCGGSGRVRHGSVFPCKRFPIGSSAGRHFQVATAESRAGYSVAALCGIAARLSSPPIRGLIKNSLTQESGRPTSQIRLNAPDFFDFPNFFTLFVIHGDLATFLSQDRICGG
jgi:hypothetical protein